MSIQDEVRTAARMPTAAIRAREVGTRYVVSGEYAEMQKLIGTLKRFGFSYDANSRSWQIALVNLVPKAREAIEGYISREQEQRQNQDVETFKVLEALLARQWTAYAVTHQGNAWSVGGLVRDATYAIRSSFQDAGWTWDANSRAYRYVSGTPARNQALLRAMVKIDDQAKASAPAAAPSVPAAVPSVPAARCTPNRHAGQCMYCGQVVEVGQGCIGQYDSSRLPGPGATRAAYNAAMNADEDRPVWLVRHKDKAFCDHLKAKAEEEAKLQREYAHNRQRAMKVIRHWAQKKGQSPSGRHRLQGRQVMLDSKSTLYGGGQWVVIEPDEKYFWYVQNNGSDGADWSANNVETGGAGAIGWRARLNPTMLRIIEFAAEK